MGGMVPLGDASRRPARVPVVTAGIIVVNVVVFVLELMRGDAFVTQWAAVPTQIVSGHHWITILTAMFMHGSWSHIIGNMIFLWAFAPEIEDAMGRARYRASKPVPRASAVNCIETAFQRSAMVKRTRGC
jgi:membrane associated rhomboid family serine protease